MVFKRPSTKVLILVFCFVTMKMGRELVIARQKFELEEIAENSRHPRPPVKLLYHLTKQIHATKVVVSPVVPHGDA